MTLAWLAEVVFFASYFVAWVSHAFDTLTSVSSGAHTFIVMTAISALVIAVLLVVDNRTIITNRHTQ